MKTAKKAVLRSSVLAVAMASSVGLVAPAAADVTAAASVANMYLWRGVDLGNGTPAVAGEVRFTQSGFYTGLWGSSGDTAAGTEYDIFAGYGAEFSGFKVDLSVWNYMYPSSSETSCETNEDGEEVCVTSDNILDDFGGLSEAILMVGYGPVSFTYYDNIAGGPGYEYYTLSASVDAFSATLGFHDNDTDRSGSTDMTHLDLSYAFNERIKFTLSQVVDEEEEDTFDKDLKFVVAYTLPIDLK